MVVLTFKNSCMPSPAGWIAMQIWKTGLRPFRFANDDINTLCCWAKLRSRYFHISCIGNVFKKKVDPTHLPHCLCSTSPKCIRRQRHNLTIDIHTLCVFAALLSSFCTAWHGVQVAGKEKCCTVKWCIYFHTWTILYLITLPPPRFLAGRMKLWSLWRKVFTLDICILMNDIRATDEEPDQSRRYMVMSRVDWRGRGPLLYRPSFLACLQNVI